MSKIEQNEILEKVKTLDPEEAKALLTYLLKEMYTDINYRSMRALENRENQNYEIASLNEEGAFAQECRLCFVKGYLGLNQ